MHGLTEWSPSHPVTASRNQAEVGGWEAGTTSTAQGHQIPSNSHGTRQHLNWKEARQEISCFPRGVLGKDGLFQQSSLWGQKLTCLCGFEKKKWLSWEIAKEKLETKKTAGRWHSRKTGHMGQGVSGHTLRWKIDILERKQRLHGCVRSTAQTWERCREGRVRVGRQTGAWESVGGRSCTEEPAGRYLPHQVLQDSTVTPLTKVMLMIHYLTTGVVRWLSGYKIQSLENAKLYGTFYFLILCYHKYVGLIYILRNLWNIYVFLTFKKYFWLFILLNVPESLFGLDKHIFMIYDGKKDDFPPQ